MDQNSVYNLLTLIPKGKVTTYGLIAKVLGCPKAARAVGNILHVNTDPIKYPCYKVVNSCGFLSSYYAFGGLNKQKELLEKDGIVVMNNQVDLKKYLFDFSIN